MSITARLDTGVALPWSFDMSKNGNVAFRRAICRDVGCCVLLQPLDEIDVLANSFDAESPAEVGELLALELVKRVG